MNGRPSMFDYNGEEERDTSLIDFSPPGFCARGFGVRLACGAQYQHKDRNTRRMLGLICITLHFAIQFSASCPLQLSRYTA